MSSKPIASDFARTKLPWLAGGALFIIYLATLNHWVSIRSLGMVGKVTGWDWTFPTQEPLFFALTYPVRWLPANWQPLALNFFAAVCAAGAVALLVRSVALLPQDRTEEQRMRMRHPDGLLTTKFAWAPAVLAASVFGLELTQWEHATAATGEALNIFIFAYLIRCLLEFRVSKNERWLFRLAFIYGLGVTNNYALLGFFPLFLGSLIWIRRKAFFKLKFIVKMTALGLVGMLMYLVLPAIWVWMVPEVSFWETLKGHLVTQKLMATHPSLRARALILSLTSIVPVIIMGVRFPAGFGDVSSAGTAITNFMFRAIHLLFAGVCIWVAFDQQFSPRNLASGMPFLTFYYLGALAVGYYVGYLMVVFSDPPKKHWRPQSSLGKLMNPVIQALAWAAVIVVPVALLIKNFRPAYAQNGKLLMDFVETVANQLPQKPALVLTDDYAQAQLIEAWFARKGNNPYVVLSSSSLPFPLYHRELVRKFGSRWPSGGAEEHVKRQIDSLAIASALNALSTSNSIYYLHPSFGYFFELFYQEPLGFVSELKKYPTNAIYAPVLSAQQMKASEDALTAAEGLIVRAEPLARRKLSDAMYVAGYLSRAVNKWGVDLRKANRLTEAGNQFDLALRLNTNNIPAMVNLEDNRERVKGGAPASASRKTGHDFLGQYRSWDRLLADNGPFDTPEYMYAQGNLFMQQMLVRQACQLFKRASELDPTNAVPKLSLATSLIHGKWLDEAHAVVTELQKTTNTTSPSQKLDLIAMESAIYFGRKETNRAEAILLGAIEKHPKALGFYESLNELYRASGQWQKSMDLLGRQISIMPSNTTLKVQRAEVSLSLGNTNLAISDLDSVLKEEPSNNDAAIFRIFVALQQKDYATAAKLTDALLERNDQNAQAHNYKGIIYMETREDEKAIAAFTQAMKYDRSGVSSRRNRAIVNLRAGHLKEAKEDYETLQKSFPRAHQVYWGLAEIADKESDKTEAIKNYELYLKYAPPNVVDELDQERKMVEARLRELRVEK